MKIIFALFSLMLFLSALAGYWFLWSETQLSRTVIADAREQAASAGEQEALIRATNIFVAEAASLESELDSFVAHDDDLVAIIETIEAAAARENVSVEVASAKVEASSWRRHEPIRAIVTGRGSFEAIASFITALEHLPIASKVQALAMESAAQGWFATIEVVFIKEKPQVP